MYKKMFLLFLVLTLIGMDTLSVRAVSVGSWQVVGNMLTARSRHTAILLPNGTVIQIIFQH